MTFQCKIKECDETILRGIVHSFISQASTSVFFFCYNFKVTGCLIPPPEGNMIQIIPTCEVIIADFTLANTHITW